MIRRYFDFFSGLFEYMSLKVYSFFYRATLCVSAVFAVVRCPSVMLVHCIQTAEDIVIFLSQPDSTIILVFGPTAGIQF